MMLFLSYPHYASADDWSSDSSAGIFTEVARRLQLRHAK